MHRPWYSLLDVVLLSFQMISACALRSTTTRTRKASPRHQLSVALSAASQPPQREEAETPRHLAILGGGLAGLGTAYHFLDKCSADDVENVTIWDRSAVGQGGASAVAGG